MKINIGQLHFLESILKKLPVQINLVDKNGWSCLHVAASKRFLDICLFLLKHGADGNNRKKKKRLKKKKTKRVC
jgi:ankyrin repeat protein